MIAFLLGSALMYTRRQLGQIALAAAPASMLFAKGDSKINGVMIGAQSYSFRDRPLDAAIKAMEEIGIHYVELFGGHIEPPRGTPKEEVDKWRSSPDTVKSMKLVKEKFNKAGITVYALNY